VSRRAFIAKGRLPIGRSLRCVTLDPGNRKRSHQTLPIATTTILLFSSHAFSSLPHSQLATLNLLPLFYRTLPTHLQRFWFFAMSTQPSPVKRLVRAKVIPGGPGRLDIPLAAEVESNGRDRLVRYCESSLT
jgi:hypothetical protein